MSEASTIIIHIQYPSAPTGYITEIKHVNRPNHLPFHWVFEELNTLAMDGRYIEILVLKISKHAKVK